MNDETKMTIEQLAEGLDRWGADLGQWPQKPGKQARELLGTSQPARRLHAQAVMLDRRLQAAIPHRAPSLLQQRILEQLPEHAPTQRLLDWFTVTLWRPAIAAGCALLVGFGVGVASPPTDDGNVADDLTMLAFTAAYAEADDDAQ